VVVPRRRYSAIELVLLKTSTKPEKEVAVAEIEPKYDEMPKFVKIMGANTAAASTHSVSEMRQINMAGDI
jgi:hypothetical protein